MSTGKSAIETTQSIEIQAGELFGKILRAGSLPAELDPLVVNESARLGHFTAIFKMLKMFGSSQRATFRTERSGQHLPADKREGITSRYRDIMNWSNAQGNGIAGLKRRYPLNGYIADNDSQYSTRLHTLVASHTPTWTEDNQKVMWLMTKVFGPTLGYQYDLKNSNVDQPGDFHLMVSWVFNNLPALDRLYGRGTDIPHIAGRIASCQGIVLDSPAINRVVRGWNGSLGEVDLRAEIPVKAKSQDTTKTNEFSRVGTNVITQRFEQLFVSLDPNNQGSIREVLDEPELDDEECDYFAERINTMHLLLLSLLTENGQSARPLTQLDQASGMQGKMQDVLKKYLDVAASAFESNPSRALNSIDMTLPGNSLAAATETILTKLKSSTYPGFGAGRALLDRLTELKVKKDPGAQNLEALMYRAIQIVEAKTTKEFNLTLKKK